MDVNYNMQSGTSVPLADIVETGSRYIKFSNGIAIVYLNSSNLYAGATNITTGIYKYEMTIYSPITFTSVLWFFMSMDVDTYIRTASNSWTVTRNASTTNYTTTDNYRFTIAPVIDMSSYALNNNYACSYDSRIKNINYFIIGKWK